jgi:hypothetical protein
MRLLTLVAGLVIVAAAAAAAAAAEVERRPQRAEIWDLPLGAAAQKLPDAYVDYACGTNGGPPSLPLSGWREFRRCRAEPSGLREVYFRYDDELEYWAKAHDYATEIETFSGTKVFGYPVVLSALFDPDGVLAGLRIVTDPRDPSRRRDEAYSLRNFLSARYGRDGWECSELAPDDGETPVGRTFVKQRCRKSVADVGTAVLQTNFFRKKGQSEFDPRTGRETKDQFESLVRFELTLGR